MVQNGLMSLTVCCEVFGPHPAVRQGKPHSSSSMGLKRAFPQRSIWAHHGSRRLMNLCRNRSGEKTSISSTSADGEQQSEMHDTTKHSNAINKGSCIVGNSGSGTESSSGS